MSVLYRPPETTEDGYKVQFGTNHMGDALLSKLVLPNLVKTAETGAYVHLAVLASSAHKYSPKEGIQFDTLKPPAVEMGIVTRYS